MAGFIYKLQNIVNSTPDNYDNDVNIARCLLKNINKIKKKTSLQEFSNICYTSQSSISRFSQRLGYDNFNDFKYDCIDIQEELREMTIDNAATQQLNSYDYAHEISKCLIEMQESFDITAINTLCKYINNADRIYLFATHIPGDLANILQRAILTTGKFIEFYPRKEHQIEIANQIKEGDLCIFFSLEGTLLMEKAITLPAITSNAISVLVTQNIHIKFSEQFTLVVGLGNHDHENIGKFKLLFFIDYLLNTYYHNYVINKKS